MQCYWKKTDRLLIIYLCADNHSVTLSHACMQAHPNSLRSVSCQHSWNVTVRACARMRVEYVISARAQRCKCTYAKKASSPDAYMTFEPPRIIYAICLLLLFIIEEKTGFGNKSRNIKIMTYTVWCCWLIGMHERKRAHDKQFLVWYVTAIIVITSLVT